VCQASWARFLNEQDEVEQAFERGIECRTQRAAWGRCDDRGISGRQLRLRAVEARFAQATGIGVNQALSDAKKDRDRLEFQWPSVDLVGVKGFALSLNRRCRFA